MSITNNLESKILDHFRYLGISGQIYEDIQELAIIARTFESIAEAWTIKREVSYVDVHGGRHDTLLAKFVSGTTDTLSLDVPQLIRKIEKIYNTNFSSTSINLNSD